MGRGSNPGLSANELHRSLLANSVAAILLLQAIARAEDPPNGRKAETQE